MKLVWFSEIKWSYLKTRKQHLLSHFSDSDEILYIEPISLDINNNFTLSVEKNIKYLTIPQVQNSDYYVINKFLQLYPLRKLLFFISKILLNRLLRKINFEPDIIITSNIHWFEYIKYYKSIHNINVIYDCNDNPLAFPNIINSEYYFLETLNISARIIIPFQSYSNFIPVKYKNKIKIISNGVDVSSMLKSPSTIIELEKLGSNIIMYIGSIDTRLDFDLLTFLVSELNEYNFVFVGDIKRQARNDFAPIKLNSNVHHFHSVSYNQISDYLSYARVCIIPFKNSPLSNSILPNKIFEYSIMRKPFIMTNFNIELKELNNALQIIDSKEEFKNKLIKVDDSNIDNLKEFSIEFDWSKISKNFQDLVKSYINN